MAIKNQLLGFSTELPFGLFETVTSGGFMLKKIVLREKNCCLVVCSFDYSRTNKPGKPQINEGNDTKTIIKQAFLVFRVEISLEHPGKL